MSTQRSVLSSDLALASKLAAGLRAPAVTAPLPKKGAVPLPEKSSETGYVRLRSRYVPPPAPPSPDVFGATAWNELLDWAIATSGGAASFLVDRHGLVVSWRGAIERDDVERLGSELAGLLDAASRVRGSFEGAVRTLALDVGGHAVTVALGDDGFALCVVGKLDVARETREAMLAALARATHTP